DDLGSGSVPGGQEGEEIFRKEGKAFFHFSGDSLAWWSTDGVPAPVGAKAEAVSQGLVFIANGYYLGRELQRGTDHWLGLQLVYRDFAYRNEYLTPSFHPVLGIPEGAVLRFTPDRGAVHGPGGEYLFSVLPGEGQRMGLPEALPAILWMLAYTLLLGLLYRAYLLLLRSPSRNLLILLGFTVDALLLRAVLLYFKQPSGLYGLDLFQPEHYASSVFTPSLGDLVLHALTLTWIAWVLFIHLPRIPLPMVRKRAMRLLAQLLVQGLVLGLFILATLQIDILVRDSSIAFDLNDLFSLNEYSLIGFASVFLIFFSFLLAGSRLTAWLAGQGKAWEYFLLPFLALVMALVWPFSTVQRASLLIYLLGIISWWLYHRRLGLRNPVGAVLCFLLLFSGLLSIKLGSSLQQREQGKRRLIAIRLTQQRDQVGEYIFGAMRKELRADTTFQRLLVQATEA
ncbi:MAG TPA: hypothetical protein P5248_10115, partial [Bacteroidales bacterium]|nr:hypothetical protein [Bacteroidales bacterium]